MKSVLSLQSLVAEQDVRVLADAGMSSVSMAVSCKYLSTISLMIC